MSSPWTIAGVIADAWRSTTIDHETVFEALREPAPMLIAAAIPAGFIGLALMQMPGPIPAVPLTVTICGMIVLLPLVHAMFQRVRENLAAAGGLARDLQGLPRAWEKTPMTHALVLAVPIAVFAGVASGVAVGLLAVDQPLVALGMVGLGLPGLIAVVSRVCVAPLISAEEPGITTRRLLAESVARTRSCAGKLFGLITVFTLAGAAAAAAFTGLVMWTVSWLHPGMSGAIAWVLILAEVGLIGIGVWALAALWLVYERAIQLAWTAETGGVIRLRFAVAHEGEVAARTPATPAPRDVPQAEHVQP